jgi:hypothetical protein
LIAQVHAGEMIVPASLASAIRSGQASLGAAGGSLTQHIHFSPQITAMDSQDVMRALSGVAGKDMMKMFSKHVRQGAHLGLGLT